MNGEKSYEALDKYLHEVGRYPKYFKRICLHFLVKLKMRTKTTCVKERFHFARLVQFSILPVFELHYNK